MKAIKVTDLTIKRASGYGQYIVSATINGQYVQARTTNSEAFDWFDDDSNEEKHEDAKAYCADLISRTFEEQF